MRPKPVAGWGGDVRVREMTWLDVVLAPSTVAPRPHQQPTQGGTRTATAMLLQARLFEFQEHFRHVLEVPADDQDHIFLTATYRYLTGKFDEALASFLELVRSGHASDLRAAAAVVATVLLSDRSRHDQVLTVLDEATHSLGEIVTDDGGVHRQAGALLEVHRGWRHAERGAWKLAVEHSERALMVVEELPGEIATLIGAVARVNSLNFRGRSDGSYGDPPPRVDLPALTDRARAVAEAHLALADEDIRAVFTSPLSRGFHLEAEDRVERNLWSATFHAETLGDFGAIRRSRRILGRTRLLRAARDSGTADADSVRLLSEGGDVPELKRMTRWFLERGPLQGLAEEVNRTADAGWLALYEHGTLALLSICGDLLAETVVPDVVAKLLDLVARPGPLTQRPYIVQDAALEALARVLPAAGNEAHAQVGAHLPSLATQLPEIHHAQSLKRVVRRLRFEALSGQNLRTWQRFVEETTETGEHDDLAGQILLRAAPADPEWARATAERAYRLQSSLLWGAVLVDLDTDLPEVLLSSISDKAGASVQAERVEAARGRYSFGGIEAPVLLAVTLSRNPDLAGWEDLLAYVADPAVSIDTKSSVADILTDATDELSNDLCNAIAEAAGPGLLGHQPHGLEEGTSRAPGPWLRLACKLDELDAATALQMLLELGGSPRPEDRVQAGWSLPYVAMILPAEVAQAALWLSADESHVVRSAAGDGAVALLATPDPGRRSLVQRALEERVGLLLREPGLLIPTAILRALANHPHPHLWDDVIRQIARGHRSALARSSAATLASNIHG